MSANTRRRLHTKQAVLTRALCPAVPANVAAQLTTNEAKGGLLMLDGDAAAHSQSMLHHVVLEGGMASRGGCMYIRDSGVLATDVTVSGCQARVAGGAIAVAAGAADDDQDWFLATHFSASSQVSVVPAAMARDPVI